MTQDDLAVENEMLADTFDAPDDEKLKVILMDRLFTKAYRDKHMTPMTEKKVARMVEKYLALLYKKELQESMEHSDLILKSYYIANPDLFTVPRQYNLKLIVVQQKIVADKLYNEISDGARHFYQVAQEESIDEQTASRKGDMGWMNENRMSPEFAIQLNGHENGYVTPPFQYGGKWVMLQIASQKPPKKRSFEDVKEGIKKKLVADELQQLIHDDFERLKKEYHVDAVN